MAADKPRPLLQNSLVPFNIASGSVGNIIKLFEMEFFNFLYLFLQEQDCNKQEGYDFFQLRKDSFL